MNFKEECKVTAAQITIDGLKDVHNKRRILKNGQDSFGIIINNIEKVNEVINIVIRVNVDKDNLKGTKNLIDYLTDEKHLDDKVNIYFYPIVNQTEACKVDIKKCFTPKEFGEIDKVLLRKLYDKGNVNLIRYLYPRRINTFCTGICSNSFVIDPEGLVYPCWDTVGIKESNIGNVKEGVLLNKEYLSWLLLETPDECKKCNILPICGSGCPLERLKNGNKPICGHKSISFIENLKIICEEYKRV